MDLGVSLRASGLRASTEAADALSKGAAVTQVPGTVSCRELESIHRMRLAHLRSLVGAHAHQLAISVQELCDGLAKNLDGVGQWVRISSGGECAWNVLVLPEHNQVLGCMRSIDKRAVSDERWNELRSDDEI